MKLRKVMSLAVALSIAATGVIVTTSPALAVTSTSSVSQATKPTPTPSPNATINSATSQTVVPMRPAPCALVQSCPVPNPVLAKCMAIGAKDGFLSGIGAVATGGSVWGGLILATVTYVGSTYWCYYLGN